MQTPTCAVELNRILLSNFLVSSLAAAETFVVVVSGMTNPSATPQAGFNLATLSTAGYVLEEKKGLGISITGSTLTIFSVSANSTATSNPDTLYTFAVGNNAPLSNGYSITIAFPSDYLFINYSSLVCTVAGVAMPCGRLNSTYSSNAHTVLIRVNGTLTAVGTLTLSSVTNPRVQTTTGAFAAMIYDTEGTAVETGGAATIAMTATGDFSSFSASTYNASAPGTTREALTGTVNSGANSVYLLLVTPFASQSSPCSLTLTLANTSGLQYSNVSSCLSVQFADSCSYATDGSGRIVVSFPSITLSSTNINYIQLELTNLLITNPSTVAISAALAIGGSPALTSAMPASLNALYAEAVSNYSLALSDYILGATSIATLTIHFSGQALSSLSSIQVYVPL
jgi:hypothetical protein